jgi:hypothetical protein
MGRVGRFVVDPRAGAYCRIRLDGGDTILVSHEKGGFKGGRLTISAQKWWGLGSGETLFSCDLDSAEGRAILSRLVSGAPEGSAQATPLGAFVSHVKDCRSASDVAATCRRLLRPDASDPGSA